MIFDRRTLLRSAAAAVLSTPFVLRGRAALAQADVSSWAAQKRKVRVKGLNMAYYETGRGDPIVFLHGNPTSSYLWRNIIPHVRHLGRCIAPDMIGMGDSDRLPDSGPGKYKFATHRDYLFGLFEALGVGSNAVFVVHDWGTGVGFSWAQRHPDWLKGLVYTEAILRPSSFPSTPEPTSGPFAIFRSAKGEQAVLQDNMFVEQLLIGGLGYYLTEADKSEYRRPYLVPGESRRPTLTWPRELPMGGRPADTERLVESYTDWLSRDDQIPKLFVHAVPGAIFSNKRLLAFVRGFKVQREVMLYGNHYVQEVSPHAMGRALAAWIPSLPRR